MKSKVLMSHYSLHDTTARCGDIPQVTSLVLELVQVGLSWLCRTDSS